MTESTETSQTRAELIRSAWDVRAFVAMDTIEALADRVTTLVQTGRQMTVIRRYLHDRPDRKLEIKSGLVVNTEVPRPLGITHQDRPEGIRFTVDCEPGIEMWGFSVYRDTAATEDKARRNYEQRTTPHPSRTSTLVRISGWPTSVDVRIDIEFWNQHGVGHITTVVFGALSDEQDFAQSQAAVLDVLADARETWSAEDLRGIAKDVRNRWQAVDAVVATQEGTQ